MLQRLEELARAIGLEGHFADAVAYFVYDSIKILLLLFALIAIIGYLRTFLKPETINRWLSRTPKPVAHFLAAVLGAATPFCSCSSIPVYLGLQSAGVPLGVSLSFLITSPLVNQYLLVLLLIAFGWKIAVLYLIAGMLIGMIGGYVAERLGMQRYLEDLHSEGKELVFLDQSSRVKQGLTEATEITRKLWPYILVGVAVGAAIHGYVPDTLIERVTSATGPFGVPLAVVLGVPLYGSGVALVPVAEALFAKGLPLGTALAFLMSVAGLSFPEAVILRRAMRIELILAFFGIVTLGIILTGYAFNLL